MNELNRVNYTVHLEGANYDWEGSITEESVEKAAAELSTEFMEGRLLSSKVIHHQLDVKGGKGYKSVQVVRRRGPVTQSMVMIVCLDDD